MGIVINSDKRETFGSRALVRGESLSQIEAEHSTKRAQIADRVTSALRKQPTITFASIETTITQLKLSDDLFYRYFDSVSDLDCEIRRRSWKRLLSMLRLVAIESSGKETLLNIARVYHRFAEDNRSIFEYVICSSRHTHEGARYFGQLGYLMRMVLLSCNVDIRKCEQMANNLIDVIHGVALLKMEGVEKRLTRKSSDEILASYISKLFEETVAVAA